MLCVTKAMFSLYFFPPHPFLFLVGMVVIASSTLLAQVVNEFWASWVTSNCSSVPISTVIAPQSLPVQDSAAVSTCGRGPDLDLRLSFTLYFKAYVLVLLAVRICKQGKAELQEVFVKWPRGLETRQEAGVFVFTKRSGWPSHNQQTLASFCLCFLFTLLHCNQTFFPPFFISYRPEYYWNDGGVIDYLPMDSLFLWFQSSIEAFFFCFPFAELELFICQPKDDKTKYGSLIVCSRAM